MEPTLPLVTLGLLNTSSEISSSVEKLFIVIFLNKLSYVREKIFLEVSNKNNKILFVEVFGKNNMLKESLINNVSK